MKKILSILIGCLVSMSVLNAATAVATITATNAVVLDGTYYLESITALQATNGLVRLYDDDDKALTNVTPAFVETRSYVTNVETSWITSGGATNNMTNTMVWYYAYTNAAATNARAPFRTIIGAVNNPVTEILNYQVIRGLVVSNSTSGDIVVRYRTP